MGRPSNGWSGRCPDLCLSHPFGVRIVGLVDLLVGAMPRPLFISPLRGGYAVCMIARCVSDHSGLRSDPEGVGYSRVGTESQPGDPTIRRSPERATSHLTPSGFRIERLVDLLVGALPRPLLSHPFGVNRSWRWTDCKQGVHNLLALGINTLSQAFDCRLPWLPHFLGCKPRTRSRG